MVNEGPLVSKAKLLGPLTPHRPTPHYASPQKDNNGFSLVCLMAGQ